MKNLPKLAKLDLRIPQTEAEQKALDRRYKVELRRTKKSFEAAVRPFRIGIDIARGRRPGVDLFNQLP